MHTPQWYGTIGIVNCAHLQRHGLANVLGRLARRIAYTAAAYRIAALRTLRPRRRRRASSAVTSRAAARH